MVSLAQLWLPILLSTVAVFFLSFLMWMVFPHHRSDWKSLPKEDDTLDSMRSSGLEEGQYSFPFCSGAEQMKDPEWIKKFEQGPSGFLIVRPSGQINMGKNMLISSAFNLVVSVLVAYVATISMTPASSGGDVFRMTATVATLGYAGALGWGAIWFSRTWNSTLKEMFDGLVYGLATGALFLAFWPAA